MASRIAWMVSVFLVLAASISARRINGSNRGPAGAIIATAALSGQATATGTATLNWMNGQGNIKVTLKGSLVNLTMAHIHVANSSLSNPIVVGILPRMNSSKPAQLSPPKTFLKGPYTFNASFDSAYLALITPAMTAERFLTLLAAGQLYVNVHTQAQPSGAIRGALACKGDCKEK